MAPNSKYIRPSDETQNRGPSYLVFYAKGSKRHHPGGKGVTREWNEYPTGTPPIDADAIAAATVQTSVVIVYILYDSSCTVKTNVPCVLQAVLLNRYCCRYQDVSDKFWKSR